MHSQRTVIALISLLLLTACAGALYVYLGINNPFIGFGADDALYLLMADLYSGTVELDLPVYQHVREHGHFPPLFPLTLSIFGAGTENWLNARIFVAVNMALCIILTYRLSRSFEIQRLHTLLICIIFAFAPSTLIYSVDVWSESSFLALLLAIFWLVEMVKSKHRGLPILFLLGALIGFLIGIRSIGVAILPGLLLLAPRLQLHEALKLFLGLLTVTALLDIMQTSRLGESYTDILLQTYNNGDLGVWFRLFMENGKQIILSSTSGLFHIHNWHSSLFFSLLCLLGLATTWKRYKFLASFICCYLVILLIWPFPEFINRFVFPLSPLLLILAYIGISILFPNTIKIKIQFISITLLLYMAANTWIDTFHNLLIPPTDPQLSAFRTTTHWFDQKQKKSELSLRMLWATEQALQKVQTHVQKNQCIFTDYTGPLMFHSKRIGFSFPSEETLKRGPPWRCDYFLVFSTKNGNYPPMYPANLLGSKVAPIAIYYLPTTSRIESKPKIAGLLLHVQ